MPYETLVVEIGEEDFIGSITLNRPKQLNTFTTPLAAELHQALLELDADQGVRVIVVKGAGKHFCAGIDVSELKGKSPMELKAWIHHMETPLVTISEMSKPVIAQVHGVAAANGAGLVAACDLAIAADSARIGLTAINVGLNCVGPVIPVSKSVGRKVALEMLLFGELIEAREAQAKGLFNRVVAAAELEQATRQWAAVLAQKSPIAVQIAKRGFYNAADMEYHHAFEYMNEIFARLCTTEDAKEGVSAFQEKRKPVWKEC